MSCVAIWLQGCLHWRCAYFQTLSWNDTIFVVDWDILYKLCGSADKCSKGFVFSDKIWWKFFSCHKACSKYHTRSTTSPKYTLPQRLVSRWNLPWLRYIVWCFWKNASWDTIRSSSESAPTVVPVNLSGKVTFFKYCVESKLASPGQINKIAII